MYKELLRAHATGCAGASCPATVSIVQIDLLLLPCCINQKVSYYNLDMVGHMSEQLYIMSPNAGLILTRNRFLPIDTLIVVPGLMMRSVNYCLCMLM